ncbi:hypothetical protein CHCC20375_2850 [Bacillus licheniformis]|nr:hypothetical protein CHCC20375_2850 [Bacillus licheniformis]
MNSTKNAWVGQTPCVLYIGIVSSLNEEIKSLKDKSSVWKTVRSSGD